MKASPGSRWRHGIAATLMPALVAGCAWCLEPPESTPSTEAVVYHPTTVMKTLPDTSAVHAEKQTPTPVVTTPADTSKAAPHAAPPPQVPAPAETAAAPSPGQTL